MCYLNLCNIYVYGFEFLWCIDKKKNCMLFKIGNFYRKNEVMLYF